MTPTTVLVTGAAGFIGSHVARHCAALGYQVVGLDDLSGGSLQNVPSGVIFRQGSITDRAFLHQVFEEYRFTYVYHLAAYAAEGLSHFIRNYNYTVNLLGSVNLINESVLAGVKCFVFTSSIAVYGAGQTPMREDQDPKPEDPYGISKFAVEMDLRAAHEMFGLNWIVFRPHNVYGEGQNTADKYRNVLGIFMNQIMQDKPLTIFGDGRQTRAFSYIDDVAPIIARSVNCPEAYQEVFNIGADQPYSVRELAQVIAEAFGTTPRIQHLAPRNEVVHAFSDHEKVRRIFHPPAPTSLRDGVHRMVDWARRLGPGTPSTFFDIEVPLRMPESWKATAR